MPSSLHLDPTDARPLGRRHAILLESGDFLAAVLEPGARVEHDPVRAHPGPRLWTLLAGRAALVGADGPTPLHLLEPRVTGGDDGDHSLQGPGRILVTTGLEPGAAPQGLALALGTRTLREELPRGRAFLHVGAGAASIRITDEEEPFELRAGESLWLEDLEGGAEAEIRGLDPDTAIALLS